jgi:tetraacyldisaccharide 4'-kinase
LRREDIEFGDDKSVLMTEKDAVKCAAFAGAQHWYVPVSACFEGVESAALLDTVIDRIQKRDHASQE